MQKNPILTFLHQHTIDLGLDLSHETVYPNPMIWNIVSYVVRNWSLIKPNGIVDALEQLVEENDASVFLCDSIYRDIIQNEEKFLGKNPKFKEIRTNILGDSKSKFDEFYEFEPYLIIVLKVFIFVKQVSDDGLDFKTVVRADLTGLERLSLLKIAEEFFRDGEHSSNLSLIEPYFEGTELLAQAIYRLSTFQLLEHPVILPDFIEKWSWAEPKKYLPFDTQISDSVQSFEDYDEHLISQKELVFSETTLILPPFHDVWKAKMKVIFSKINVPFSFLTMTYTKGIREGGNDFTFE